MSIQKEFKQKLQNGFEYEVVLHCGEDQECLCSFIVGDLKRYFASLPERDRSGVHSYEFKFGNHYYMAVEGKITFTYHDGVELLTILSYLDKYNRTCEFCFSHNEDFFVTNFKFFKNGSGYLLKYDVKNSELRCYSNAIDIIESTISEYFSFLPERKRYKIGECDVYLELNREIFKYINFNVKYTYFDDIEKCEIENLFKSFEKTSKYIKIENGDDE